AQHVFKHSIDEAARARAGFIIGEIARAQGRPDAAREAYSAVAKIEDSVLAKSRNDVTAGRWYARALGRIAELDAVTDPIAARNVAEGVVAMLRALTQQVGEPPALSADIADAEFRLAVLDLDFSVPSAARRRLGEAIGRYEALCVAEPAEAHWRAMLAEAQALLSEAAFALNDAHGARIAMDKALKLRVKLATVDPAERWALAGAWRVRAALLQNLGDLDEAKDCLIHAAALATQLRAESGDADPSPARFLTHALIEQTELALKRDALPEALEHAEAARAIAEAFAQSADAGSEWRVDLATIWSRLSEIARRAGAPTQALDAGLRAVELRRQTLDADKTNQLAQRRLADALVLVGEAALHTSAIETARNAFGESLSLRLHLAESHSGNLEAARDLAVAMERVGIIAAAQGDRNGARAMWEEEYDLIERVYHDASDIEGQRMRAIVEAHLASLGGVDAAERRASALARLDVLARDGKLSERDTLLRKKLWQA
ncbi:MAG: hypothetical protein ABUS57_22505, partial [Pseudomonadota bacterium]